MLETNISNAILWHYSLIIISNDVNYIKYLLITEWKLAAKQWVSVSPAGRLCNYTIFSFKTYNKNHIFRCHLTHVKI